MANFKRNFHIPQFHFKRRYSDIFALRLNFKRNELITLLTSTTRGLQIHQIQKAQLPGFNSQTFSFDHTYQFLFIIIIPINSHLLIELEKKSDLPYRFIWVYSGI